MKSAFPSSLKSASRSACLPFLYHTKTLAPVFLKCPVRSASKSFRRPIHRPFSSQAPKPEEPEEPEDPEEDAAPSYDVAPSSPQLSEEEIAQQELDELEKARVRREAKRAYAQEVASYPSFKEWKKSKKETEVFQSPRKSRPSKISRSEVDQFDPDIRWVEENEKGESFEEDNDPPNRYRDRGYEPGRFDMSSYRPGAPPKESTITESERLAFNRIFSDIFSKMKDKGLDTTQSRKYPPPITPNVGEAKRQTAELMREAVVESNAMDRAEESSLKRPDLRTIKFLGEGEEPWAIEKG